MKINIETPINKIKLVIRRMKLIRWDNGLNLGINKGIRIPIARDKSRVLRCNR